MSARVHAWLMRARAAARNLRQRTSCEPLFPHIAMLLNTLDFVCCVQPYTLTIETCISFTPTKSGISETLTLSRRNVLA